MVLLSLWSDDIDIETIEVFGNSNLGDIDQRNCSICPTEHPVQVPRWASNITLGIKTKFKEFSREILKKN